MANPFLTEYVNFIQQATAAWESGGGDPATITGLNSSSNVQPTVLSMSHTITTPRGSDTQTKQTNIGVVMAVPATASAPAAGGTGAVSIAVSPQGTAVVTESDQPWLTASVAGTTLTWTAVENTTTMSRMGTIRMSTNQQSYSQTVTITQAAATGAAR